MEALGKMVLANNEINSGTWLTLWRSWLRQHAASPPVEFPDAERALSLSSNPQFESAALIPRRSCGDDKTPPLVDGPLWILDVVRRPRSQLWSSCLLIVADVVDDLGLGTLRWTWPTSQYESLSRRICCLHSRSISLYVQFWSPVFLFLSVFFSIFITHWSLVSYSMHLVFILHALYRGS